jgi:hypothetical protein
MLGILDTQQLWATHYKFLNDYSEIVLFRERVIEFLRPHVMQEYRVLVSECRLANEKIAEQGGLDSVVRHDATAVVDAMYRALSGEIYIASFCGEHHEDEYINTNGLLSQWRGYGGDGGFALVFRSDQLEDLRKKESETFDYDGIGMGDLVYSDNDERFTQELSSSLAHIANYTKELFLSMKLAKEQAPNAAQFYPAFIQCISRYKHRGFKEENEVRIVAVPARHNAEYLALAREHGKTPKPEKQRKFRDVRGQPVPYIELFQAPLPIERIIIGPHRDKEARASALRVKLRNTGIEVTVSEIPYVC